MNACRDHTRPVGIGLAGRPVYGPTRPGQARPCPRRDPLSDAEVDEVVAVIGAARRARRAAQLPERLRTRHWPSVEKVLLGVDRDNGRAGAGWKVGAASEEIRRAEGLPSPSPGRIHAGTVFPSGARLERDLFVNYRNVECEFAFRLGGDFPARDRPWTEADARAGIDSLMPALELGDSVFTDWYGSSSYFGTCLDNGGGAALVHGDRCADWAAMDLAGAGVELYMNGWYLKSGMAAAAMGHPVTSLTWLLNWTRSHGITVAAGEVVSTGTCTGHCFAVPGDSVRADFGPLGCVEVEFA